MQTQYINELLNLPELKVHQILSIDSDELHIEAHPLNDKQCCPYCGSDQNVIRKGSNGLRTVRHLFVFERKPICTYPPFVCIVQAAKSGLFGPMSS
jgi:transposase